MALDKYGYRQYLKDKGLTDEQITYDPNSQSVMAKGKFFANAAPEADGSTYGTRGNLDAMYKAYQTQNMPSYKDRTDTLLNQAEQRLGQPAKQFQYNAQADPLYQNALQAAQTGAATQQGNTLARLRSMGQGKSSYSEGVANQIGQQAVADVNSKVLPQLTAQAYQRYVDEQQMGRQNTQDLLGLGQAYSNLDQRGLDNAYRQDTFGEQKKQNNLDAAYKVGQQLNRVLQPKDDYSNLYNQTDAPLNAQGEQIEYQKARDSIADERYKQKFDEDVRQFGLQHAMQAASQANAFANANADNARADSADKRAATSAEQNRLMDIWQATGKAPEGIPGVAPGTLMAGKQPAPGKPKTAENYYNNFDDSRFINKASKDSLTGKVTPQSVADPQGLEIAILSLDLPENELKKLYNRYQLKWGD